MSQVLLRAISYTSFTGPDCASNHKYTACHCINNLGKVKDQHKPILLTKEAAKIQMHILPASVALF